VDGGPALRSPSGLRPQVVPVRLLPAEVALRQLDQQRPGWFGDRGQVVDGQQPGLVAGRAAGQAVQPLEGPVLVPVQVAQGWYTTVRRWRRSACTRSTDCWAIVPLGR